MVNMSVFVTINPCASVSVGGLLRGGVSLGGSRLIRGPSCGSALTNSKAFVERPKRSRPVHSLLVKKLPILVDLDEEVSVCMCNIEQGVHLSCVFDLIAQIRRSGSLTMLVQQLAFIVQVFDFDDDILLRLGQDTRFLPHGYNLCVYPVGCVLNVHIFHSVIVH